MADQQYSQGQLDAMARQLGYHDYATWQGHQRLRNGIIDAGGAKASAVSGGAPTGNWLQNLMEKIPLSPAFLMKYVNDQFTGATGQ